MDKKCNIGSRGLGGPPHTIRFRGRGYPLNCRHVNVYSSYAINIMYLFLRECEMEREHVPSRHFGLLCAAVTVCVAAGRGVSELVRLRTDRAWCNMMCDMCARSPIPVRTDKSAGR